MQIRVKDSVRGMKTLAAAGLLYALQMAREWVRAGVIRGEQRGAIVFENGVAVESVGEVANFAKKE